MNDRPGPDEYAPFYAGYVARVPSGDIIAILRDQLADTNALLTGMSPERAAHRYAEDKWTVRQVVGHMADVERVMAYRALRFARADRTPLPGFEEGDWAATAGSDDRSVDALLAELAAVRASTVALLAGLPPQAWTRDGTANGARVTVRALACIIAGHELHHREILATRYGLGGVEA